MQVSADDIERIKADCQKGNLPLIEEFEYKKDVDGPELKIELKSTTQVRDYQEQSLAKMGVGAGPIPRTLADPEATWVFPASLTKAVTTPAA